MKRSRRPRLPVQAPSAFAGFRFPPEVITDKAPALAHVIDEPISRARFNTGQYENNRCETDHG